MRERFSAIRIAMLCICVAACAGQPSDEEGPSSGPVAELEDVPAMGAAPAPASAATVPEQTPTAPPAEQSDVSTDDAPVVTPQARIFGVGTSCPSTNPCRNGGTCVEQWIGYSCRCAPGFSGDRCQTPTSSSRCGNGVIERSAGEDCEVGVDGWTSATCLLCLQTVYRPRGADTCFVTSDNVLGPSNCPRAGAFTPTCLAVYGMGCYVACNSDSSCPVGYKCSPFAGTPFAFWKPQYAGYCQ